MQLRHGRVDASSAFVFIFLAIVTDVSNANFHSYPLGCCRSCIAENCNTASIRYGKYCGLGHTGCAGEQPCDDADACCQIHDDCVGNHGMMNVTCHKRFKVCLEEVAKAGKVGFSPECPYQIALPTMQAFMDLAVLIGDLGPTLNI